MATVRGKWKTAARAIVKELYHNDIFPRESDFENGVFGQADWEAKTAENAKRLLSHSHFHHYGVDDQVSLFKALV